jgi:NAD(P)-dependent dehydrogenase (short-subunit alcohol dehydrogenase family)
MGKDDAAAALSIFHRCRRDRQPAGGGHDRQGGSVNLEGCVALVTGANRGLGKGLAEGLLAAGARKVYAGVRAPQATTPPGTTPIRLDVTSANDVQLAAEACGDVTLLVNNAGILLAHNALDSGAEDALRDELNVNVFGVMRMARALAPILNRNGGGAMVNVLSVVSWFVTPVNATYCASKHAALAITDALRTELRSQNTHVHAVYAGFIDTDMATKATGSKTSVGDIVARTLDGIRSNSDHILADARAAELWQALKSTAVDRN